ncbi:MAG: hypothetical protein KDC47_10865, partial [Flavobacteriaceae bacterium]|nr:hypothetical protein [Flavobacteriaceae bacterium]
IIILSIIFSVNARADIDCSPERNMYVKLDSGYEVIYQSTNTNSVQAVVKICGNKDYAIEITGGFPELKSYEIVPDKCTVVSSDYKIKAKSMYSEKFSIEVCFLDFINIKGEKNESK